MLALLDALLVTPDASTSKPSLVQRENDKTTPQGESPLYIVSFFECPDQTKSNGPNPEAKRICPTTNPVGSDVNFGSEAAEPTSKLALDAAYPTTSCQIPGCEV